MERDIVHKKMIQDPNLSFLRKNRLILLGISVVLPVAFLAYKYTHPTLKPVTDTLTSIPTQKSALAFEAVEINKIVPLAGTTRDVVLNTKGDLAYVAAYGQGVHVLSLERPLTPEVLSSFKYRSKHDNVIKLMLSEDEKILYALDEAKGVYSLNVQDPSHPKLIDFVSLSGGKNFTLSSNTKRIYVSGKFGVGVIALKKDKKFELLGRLHYLPDLKKYVMDQYLPNIQYAGFEAVADVVEVDADTLYIMSRHPDVIDISNLSNIKILTHFSTLGSVRQVTISKNRERIYLASGESGIEIFEIADHKHPRPLGGHNTEGYAEHTSISKNKNILYVSTFKGGLQLFDITYPYDPKLIKSIEIKKGVKKGHAIGSALSVDEKVLYVAYGVTGLGIITLEKAK